MFKHLLIPTDGSAASEHTIRKALALAREGNSQVTGLHVISPYHLVSYEVDMIEETRASYEANVQARARKYLDAIERCGREMSVSVRTRTVVAAHPYEAIIATALEAGCDLIVMTSHGHRGTKAVLLGGETQKVLTHSTLPVLVLR
jgi:nucleotide-binding universal stress UspA family protein